MCSLLQLAASSLVTSAYQELVKVRKNVPINPKMISLGGFHELFLQTSL